MAHTGVRVGRVQSQRVNAWSTVCTLVEKTFDSSINAILLLILHMLQTRPAPAPHFRAPAPGAPLQGVIIHGPGALVHPYYLPAMLARVR
eukprot:6908171-Prymnesium_polylepis.1